MSNIFNEYPYRNFTDLNLDFLLNKFKLMIDDIASIDEKCDSYDEQIKQIETLYQQIITGDFPESIKNAFYDWMNENAIDIVGDMVKNVFFGLTDSGFFVAYIPESWKDIVFNTSDYDILIEDVEYGHLILSY